MKKINDNYPKYILTLDDDLDVDFDEIKKINVLDWLLDKKIIKYTDEKQNMKVIESYRIILLF